MEQKLFSWGTWEICISFLQGQNELIYLFRCNTLFSTLAARFTVAFPAIEKEKKENAELV